MPARRCWEASKKNQLAQADAFKSQLKSLLLPELCAAAPSPYPKQGKTFAGAQMACEFEI
jgi:hypothetical protein